MMTAVGKAAIVLSSTQTQSCSCGQRRELIGVETVAQVSKRFRIRGAMRGELGKLFEIVFVPWR